MTEIQPNVSRAESEELRWIVLITLNTARPQGCNEHIIRRTANDVRLPITSHQVRTEMDYLSDLGLITLDRSQQLWFGKILPKGVDVVTYRAECPAGISRPSEW